MIEFKKVFDPQIASLIKERLISEGIKCELSSDDSGGMHVSMTALTGIKILIDRSDALRASEILKASEISDEDLEALSMSREREDEQIISAGDVDSASKKELNLKYFSNWTVAGLVILPVVGQVFALYYWSKAKADFGEYNEKQKRRFIGFTLLYLFTLIFFVLLYLSISRSA